MDARAPRIMQKQDVNPQSQDQRWGLLQETPCFVVARERVGRLWSGALVVAVEMREHPAAGTSAARVDVREARGAPAEVVVEVGGVGAV